MPPRAKNGSVSVIIPAYNAERTLSSCLDALLEQTHLANEILVVDDGSTDQTKAIAEAYSLVTVITQTNQGPAKARNAGARKAKSDIILFLDSDCVPEKTWLEEMLLPFRDDTVMGVQGAYRTNQTSWVARFDQADIEYRYERMKRVPTLDWIATYSAAYRRRVFLEEGGFDETFPKASGEDAAFSYRLATKGMRLVFAPRAIVFHTHPEKLGSYLRVKYFRAYWRARMYLKFPQKMARDSYTPHELKLSFFVGGLFFIVLAASILDAGSSAINVHLLKVEAFTWVFFLAIIGFTIIFTMSDLLWSIFKKDKWLVPGAILIIFLRSLFFVLGAGKGILDPRVRA